MPAKDLISLAAFWVLFAAPAIAELPGRVEKCLPYPTRAQDMVEMYPEPPEVKVNVRVIGVEVDAASGISSEAQEEISGKVGSLTFGGGADADYLTDFANQIAAVRVRGFLQDRGYCRATALARLTLVEQSAAEIRVAATISAQPGPPCQTGDIRIELADGSSPLAVSQGFSVDSFHSKEANCSASKGLVPV